MPPLDESRPADYIGKVILVGVTYLDHKGRFLDQKQWAGAIDAFSNKDGIRIKRRDSESYFCLPPDAEALEKAPPGSYRLRSSGEVIDNPDYLAAWTCIQSAQKKTNSKRKSREPRQRRPPRSASPWP